MQELGLARERGAGPLERAAALDPHLARAVHHHLVHVRIRQQRVERPEPGGKAHHALRERGPLDVVESGRLAIHERAHLGLERGAGCRPVTGLVDQAAAQRVRELVERVHAR